MRPTIANLQAQIESLKQQLAESKTPPPNIELIKARAELLHAIAKITYAAAIAANGKSTW